MELTLHESVFPGLLAAEDPSIVRILDAACQLLADGRRATMNEIAETAGLGVATVYRRFPQKAQLVHALLLREAARAVVTVANAMDQDGTVEEQSAAGFAAFAHAIEHRPFLVRAMRGEGPGGVAFAAGELADQVMVMARDYIAGWIRGLQAQGRYLGIDADIVAEIEARLALSLVLAPEGRIPMHHDAATRAFAAAYLVPLLGKE